MPGLVRPFLTAAAGGLLASSKLSSFKASSNVGQVVVCTPTQEAEIQRLWSGVATSGSACDPYAIDVNGIVLESVPCTATECLKEYETLMRALPDCALEGDDVTERQYIDLLLEDCKDGKKQLNKATSGEDFDPNSVCTAEQTEKTISVFVEASQIEECKDYTIVWSQYIGIMSPCESLCTEATFKLLNQSLPDCDYELDGVNKKRMAEALYEHFCASDPSRAFWNTLRAESIPGVSDRGGVTSSAAAVCAETALALLASMIMVAVAVV